MARVTVLLTTTTTWWQGSLFIFEEAAEGG